MAAFATKPEGGVGVEFMHSTVISANGRFLVHLLHDKKYYLYRLKPLVSTSLSRKLSGVANGQWLDSSFGVRVAISLSTTSE